MITIKRRWWRRRRRPSRGWCIRGCCQLGRGSMPARMDSKTGVGMLKAMTWSERMRVVAFAIRVHQRTQQDASKQRRQDQGVATISASATSPHEPSALLAAHMRRRPATSSLSSKVGALNWVLTCGAAHMASLSPLVKSTSKMSRLSAMCAAQHNTQAHGHNYSAP